MDNFTHTKQPHHHYKSPRLQKQVSNDANSKNNENLRKSLALPIEGESPAKKGVHYFRKTTSEFATGQSGTYGPLAKAMTPKVLNNMINQVGLQDSSKKGNKGSHVDRIKDNISVPHMYDEDKLHIDEIKMTKGLEIPNGDMENQRQSFGQVAKLPAIHTKKVTSRTEAKKKYTRRVGIDRQTNHIGLVKGEFDVVANPLNISNRGTHSNSSPLKQLGVLRSQLRYENEEDVNTSLGTLCIDERGKNRGLEPLSTGGPLNVIRKRYASGCARTLQCTLSGGEEEETPKENLSFSLLIAPVKGAQRTVKQIKKKTEVLKDTNERKDRSVDLADLKKMKEKIVEKVKGKIRKPREEEKAQADQLSARKKQKIAGEDMEEKKKDEVDMEDWEKDDSKEIYDKEKEVEKEEEKEGFGEFAKKLIERDQEEKVVVEDQEVKVKEEANKGKPKERTPKNAVIKKIGVASPSAKEIPQETKEVTNKSELVAAVVARANKRLQNHLHASKMMEREKDILQMKREHAYKEFMLRLNFSYNVKVRVPTEKTFTAYKYFLGKGNNSIMLKSMMKQRWWWVQIDNKDAADINFLWTQMKLNKFIDNLKQKRKTPFEGLEGNALSSYSDTTANSLTSLDSGTDNESDTAENEVASAGKPAKRTKGRRNTKKSKKSEEESKSHEDIHAAGLKKLFTSNEIMLMNTLTDSKGNMPLNPEEYEEIMKSKKGPAPQVIANPSGMKMCNHLENNFHLANKKALLWNMRSYYEAIKENVFDRLPLTFHVRNGFEDKEYQKFLEYYTNREKEIEEQEKAIQESKDAKKNIKKLRNIWIVKPGECTNRGIGIHVCNELSQINELVATTEGNINGKKRTYLIQQYLDRPFLYNKRKFDIRCYILMSCVNGTMKGYWYQEGYIRTASKEFSLKNVTNKLVHLTNDAVQKKAEDYGKFEAGNKLSYGDFQKYLDQHYGNINFNNDIYPKIRQLAIDSIRAVYGKIDPHRRENCFEIFGLDFMIDTDLRAWLIEVNTNPDINASSPALTKVIPNMVENALRLTIDQMYPPPVWQASKKQMLPENLLENNKFELVFDEVEDGPALRSILQTDKGATGDLILEIVAEEEEEDAEEECKD